MTTPTATIFLPYHALDDVILRGTRAAQPAATAVVPGTLYGVTDEGNVVERSTGAVWQAYGATGGGGAPAAHHATHEPGGADALVNAAWTNQANTFVTDQVIAGSGRGLLVLVDQAQPANQRVFVCNNTGGQLYVSPADDAAIGVAPYGVHVDRAHNLKVGADLYEKGRVTPMGHWIDVPFSAGNFSGTAPMTWTVTAGQIGTNRYMLVGKTLFWTLMINASTLGGTAAGSVVALLPGGLVAAATSNQLARLQSSGWRVAALASAGGSAALQVTNLDFANFIVPDANFYLWFSLALEVQ